MISKNTKWRVTCISCPSLKGCGKEAKKPCLRLASLLTIRLAIVPTMRWAQVLAPVGMAATQIVKVKSQKREQKEKEQLDTASGAFRSHILFCDFDPDPNRLHGGGK